MPEEFKQHETTAGRTWDIGPEALDYPKDAKADSFRLTPEEQEAMDSVGDAGSTLRTNQERRALAGLAGRCLSEVEERQERLTKSEQPSEYEAEELAIIRNNLMQLRNSYQEDVDDKAWENKAWKDAFKGMGVFVFETGDFTGITDKVWDQAKHNASMVADVFEPGGAIISGASDTIMRTLENFPHLGSGETMIYQGDIAPADADGKVIFGNADYESKCRADFVVGEVNTANCEELFIGPEESPTGSARQEEGLVIYTIDPLPPDEVIDWGPESAVLLTGNPEYAEDLVDANQIHHQTPVINFEGDMEAVKDKNVLVAVKDKMQEKTGLIPADVDILANSVSVFNMQTGQKSPGHRAHPVASIHLGGGRIAQVA